MEIKWTANIETEHCLGHTVSSYALLSVVPEEDSVFSFTSVTFDQLSMCRTWHQNEDTFVHDGGDCWGETPNKTVGQTLS